ncbi:MAG: hypothetical protein AB7S38_27730 [Vulcanimicrobiota bacterium]
MQDREADQLLGWVAAKEPGSVDQLLEATADQAHRHTGGDLDEARRVYQTMFEHLDEVGPSTQFWAWFDQILGGQKSRPEDEPSDKWLAKLKKGLKTEPQVERQPFRRRLMQMALNGWFAGFGASLPLAWPYFRDEVASSNQLAFTAIFALVNATVFALAVGPWLSGWRRDLRSTRVRLRAVMLAAVATFWSLATLTAGQLYWRFGLKFTLWNWADSLDEVFLRVDGRLLALSWAAGLLGCSLAMMVAHQRSWALYQGETWWRRVLGLALIVPVAWGLVSTVWLASLKTEYDPGLLDVKAVPSPSLEDLPAAYEQHPVIVRINEAGGVKDLEEARQWSQLWLEAVDSEWNGERPWNKLSIRALGLESFHFAPPEDRWSPVATPSAIEVELVRQTIVPGTFPPFDLWTQFRDGNYPPATWERWTNKALRRTDLAQGLPSAQPELLEWVKGTVPEAVSEDHFFQRRLLVYQYNAFWRALSKLPPEASARPLTRSELVALTGEDDHGMAPLAEHPRLFFSVTESQRRGLAALIILLELKRLQSQGQPLPTRWDEFRPEVAELGHAYADWFRLSQTEEGLELSPLNIDGTPIESVLIKQNGL